MYIILPYPQWLINSTIFKTTEDGGLTNVFKELKSVQLTFEELDKTTLRSAIKSFNNTSISVDDLSQKFGGLDDSVVAYLNNTTRGQASIDGLSKSVDKSATSMASATIKAQILSVALNALTGLAISLAIKGITWAVDELIVTLDEQKEKLDDAVNSYEESKTELASVNDELKTATERIDELNSKDNLTFTEQDELEKLIKTNDELERKIYLLEQANKEAEKEVATEAQNTYDKYINDRNIGAVEQIDFYSESSLLDGANWDNYKNDLSWLVAQYRNQQEILLNAQENGWTAVEEKTKSNLELLEGYMSEASLNYQDLYEKIGNISDVAMTDELKVAEQDLDNILDIVAEILGYGGKRSNTSFDDIWNSEEFSKYKSELESISKEGKLDASVLESNENYKKLLENTGATAKDTAQHINALVNEMEQSGNVNYNKIDISSISSQVSSFTTAQEALNTALSEQNSTGTISSETLATLRDNFENIDDAIELTTKGIIINTDKLNELNKSQKDLIGSQLDEAEEKLTKEFNDNSNELAILSERLANNTDLTNYQRQAIEQKISVLEEEQVATRGQIAELRNLQLEYENSISTHNRFINALSSEDAGSGYDAVTSALDQVEKEWSLGNVGKDEFRNFVDYMTYEDMSNASTEEVVAGYQRAMEMARMYFTETSEGSQRFLELLEEHKLATNTDGMWDIDIDDLDAAAKEIGVSTDFLIDNLDKLKDKGFSVEYIDTDGLTDQQSLIKEIDSQIEDIYKKIDRGADKSLFKDELDELYKLRQEALDGISFESAESELESVNAKLKSLYAQMDRGGATPEILEDIKYWEGRKVDIELVIETKQAEQEILSIQEEIDKIRMENAHIGSAAVVDQLTAPLKQQQQELAQKYNIDLEAVISSNIDEQTNELQETVENLDLSTEIDVSANTKKAKSQIDDVVNRDYRAKVTLEVNDTDLRLKIATVIDKALAKHKESESGDSDVNGSANVFGSAYAKGKHGNWKTGVTGKSLVGELGQEILVRDGTFRTIGDNGAELIDIKKDDIIFNH